MSDPIQNRYDISFFFDVRNGNPNGDPDAGNMPRIDPETGLGIVSDVCLKRKVRNYVELSMGDSAGYRIYVQDGVILNDRNREAYVTTGIKLNKKKLPKDEEGRAVTRFMCDNFFDIRTFGAVMTTEVNCGQVRGPVQFCFSDSIDPIVPSEMSITRMAVTNEKDKAAESGRTMGRKQFVPYGLYRMNGFISAPPRREERLRRRGPPGARDEPHEHVRGGPLGVARTHDVENAVPLQARQPSRQLQERAAVRPRGRAEAVRRRAAVLLGLRDRLR